MRFRLRTLLIVVTLFCGVLGGWPLTMHYLSKKETDLAWKFSDLSANEEDEEKSRALFYESFYHHDKAAMYRFSVSQPWLLITGRPPHP